MTPRFPPYPRWLPLLFALYAAGTWQVAAQPQRLDQMSPMDHGPFASSTLAADPLNPRSIIVYKGIAAKVGATSDAVMVFDTDLLRVATAWTGGFLKWYPARDGLQEWPGPDGFTHFSTGQRPGWSRNQAFTDPRPRPYGPVPKTLGAYKGLYIHGDHIVYSYTVGMTTVLEMPGFQRVQERPVFTRTFNLGPTTESLSLHVLQAPDGPATTLAVSSPPVSKGSLQIQTGGESRTLGFDGLPSGARWRLANQHLILDLPPLVQSLRFTIAIGPVLAGRERNYIDAYLEQSPAVPDLTRYQQPGPARWPVLETQAVMGDNSGPFAVDELTAPNPNPWRSFLRFSAVDFMSDGRAVVSSLSGDVWLVEGIGETLGKLRWKRFATGLNQPLGVKVVNDQIYINGRDQITRLHDRNGDDEADFYENFNNQVMAATNFHAFTLNLDTDSKGNFYFAKATPWPPAPQGVKAEITPHHGVLFRLPPDGSNLEVIATGLRNPNGLSIGPDDEIVYSDNEGNWSPTSKVQRIKPGAFHGFMPSAHRPTPPNDFEKPILWAPHFVDNSPSTPIFITSPSWPPALQGQLLLTSYGRGNLSLILKENIDGQWQGAHLTLPLKFKSGTQHGRFHRDGHLYIAGLTSWQSVGHGGDFGSLHRVRSTGRPLHVPVAVNTTAEGVELTFNEALDPERVRREQAFTVTQWTYPWTSLYGTRARVYSVKNPGATGADKTKISAVRLSDDRKTITLVMPELRQDLARTRLGIIDTLPEMIETSLGLVMSIDYSLRSADGVELKQVVHKTIHRMPGGTPGAAIRPDEAGHVMNARTHPIPASAAASATTPSGRSVAAGEGRVVEIRSTGIALSYDVTEIRAKAGERLTLRYINASEMVHNIVVLKAASDINPVGLAAIAAHADQFVPKDKLDRIVAYSKLAHPGETITLELTVPPPGVYPYICTVSGHFTVMQGQLHSTD